MKLVLLNAIVSIIILNILLLIKIVFEIKFV